MGGNNIANPGALQYVLQAVTGPIFGVDRFPDVYSKAAAYTFHIIRGHVFRDGNKRTGIEAAFLFLEKNGIVLPRIIDPDELIHIALSVQRRVAGVDEIACWLRAL
jgi:death-on-curing protein